jgi:hypothetical protein
VGAPSARLGRAEVYHYVPRRRLPPARRAAILGARMPDRYKYLAIIGFIAAAVLGSQLLFKFYEWDRLQNCATAGGRNCGGQPMPLDR